MRLSSVSQTATVDPRGDRDVGSGDEPSQPASKICGSPELSIDRFSIENLRVPEEVQVLEHHSTSEGRTSSPTLRAVSAMVGRGIAIGAPHQHLPCRALLVIPTLERSRKEPYPGV